MPNQNTIITKTLDANIDLIETMLKNGFSVAEISKKIGYGYSGVYNAVRRNGLEKYISVKNNGKSQTAHTYNESRIKFSKEQLEKEYLFNENTLEDIAKKYGCSASNICIYLKKYNIKARTKSEASVLAYEKHGEKIRDKHRQNAYEGKTGIHMKGRSRTSTWIENVFEEYCIKSDIPFKKQYQINSKGHRYDFLIYDNILIELDGTYWHNTEKQKMLDERHNCLAKYYGYDIIRFTDLEIKKTKGECFDEIRKYDRRRTSTV